MDLDGEVFFPFNFLFLGREPASLRLATTVPENVKIYAFNSLGMHIKNVFMCVNKNNSTQK